MLHLYAWVKVILARRHDGDLSNTLPATERRQRRIRQRRAIRDQLLMDSHEIPLAGSQKIEDLLAVGLGFLRPLYFRYLGGVRAQHFAHGRSRQLQHACDPAFAHSFRTQFQNRGSLFLAQHVRVSVPFRFVPPSGRVRGVRFRSGLGHVLVAGDPSPAGLRRAACRRDAGWPPPSPVHAPEPPRPVWWPAAAAAFSKIVPARRGCVRGSCASRPARRHRAVRLVACRNGTG